MKPVLVHAEAKAELDEAIAFYEQQSAGLGLDFQKAVERAIAKLQENPHLGPHYKTTEFRHYLVRRFPYIIFYVEQDEALWVAAVAHGSRRPGYWRRRRIR